MFHMARAYLTKKQMPRNYIFFAITHAAWVMNAIHGEYKDHFALPFLLVHGVGQDEGMWMLLFLLCYFHHEKDGNETRSKHMAHTMDGAIVDRYPTSNTLMVFNPWNGHYYEPDSTALIHIGFLAWCIPP